jgi:hypothetical protein
MEITRAILTMLIIILIIIKIMEILIIAIITIITIIIIIIIIMMEIPIIMKKTTKKIIFPQIKKLTPIPTKKQFVLKQSLQ